jgi:hypothetical protein
MSFGMVLEQPRGKCYIKFSTALWQQLLYTLSFGQWQEAQLFFQYPYRTLNCAQENP